MEFWELAQKATPVVVILLLGAVGVLWRQHIQDQQQLRALGESMAQAGISMAKAVTRIAGKFERPRQKRRRR